VEGYDRAQPPPIGTLPAENRLKGYWIAHIDVTDPEGYKDYQADVATPFGKFGGRYLIRGGRIYDHDGDVHQPAVADLLISGETIERIAPSIAPDPGVETIDARGKLVIPGMVNAHYHSHDVLAKGLCTDAKGFIFDEPTRGIDVGAKAEIYGLIDSLVNQGKAVLIISSELPEIIGICDRVYVMAEGRLSGMVDRAGVDQVTLLKLSFSR